MAYKFPHLIVLTIMSFISFFLSFHVFVVGLFPINMAIDDALDLARLFSINQTFILLL